MTGTFEHTIDGKGRLILPARLKEELGDSFHLAMGTDECLAIYPQAAWDALCQLRRNWRMRKTSKRWKSSSPRPTAAWWTARTAS